MPKKLNHAITKSYAAYFSEALAEGYGVDLTSLDYNAPDSEMIKHLLNNVYEFSAAKNHAQMTQLTRAMIDNDGKLRSWSQFKQAAFEINNTHVAHHMKAEYDTAVGSAQMASKWVGIQKNKDNLPLLQFDAILDGQTTDLCRSLEGVIKPIDDPFWNTYYPPNHYRCRSIVRQLASGKITPDHEIVHPEKVPQMFKTNLAKTGLLWPKDHPYWIGVPKEEFLRVIKLLPYDFQFNDIEIEGAKGKLRMHKLIDLNASDYDINLQIASEYAIQGSRVDIMPNVNADTDWGKIVFPDGKRGKSPDLRIDGKLWEVETAHKPWSKNNIKHSVREGSKQADYVIVNTGDFELSAEAWNRLFPGRFKDHTDLKEIRIWSNGKLSLAKKRPGKP